MLSESEKKTEKTKNVPRLRFAGFNDEWEQRKLGEIFNERTEKKDVGELISVTINAGVVKASELNRKDNSSSNKSNYKVVKKGDIAYNSMRMWQGASGFSRYDGIVSPAYTVISPKDNINAKFISYVFKKTEMLQIFQRNSQGLTSDTWNLKFPALSTINLMVPNYDEQIKISVFFEELDQLIALYQSKLDLLEEKKKGYLQKMFPKKGENVPELRFPGYTNTWEQRKLGDLTESFEYGLNASAKVYDGINKYVRITDIDDETHTFKMNSVTSPDTDLKFAGKYRLKKGDILFARTGASVGKTYCYRESDGFVYYAGFLVRARIKPQFNYKFVFQNTLTETYKKFIRVTSQRSGQPGVNAKEYSSLKIMVPRIEEQSKIGNFLSKIDHLITLHQRKLAVLEKRKKAYLQKMFV